ncbi:hypothetical protein C2W64_04749 [Brevibacillus laterosporus]|nr:hypothetical protein C2W64_04749 [Brevibacillus laterosporus]
MRYKHPHPSTLFPQQFGKKLIHIFYLFGHIIELVIIFHFYLSNDLFLTNTNYFIDKW